MTQSIINTSLHERGIVMGREINELLISYIESLIPGTEYAGKMTVMAQNATSAGENSIIVGVTDEIDAMNAYNGKMATDPEFNTMTYRHDRDVLITIEINMSDNDALWMFSKFIMMNLIKDMVRLTSSGLLKIAQPPDNGGIRVNDLGARKIWTSRITQKAKIHNFAEMTAEIY